MAWTQVKTPNIGIAGRLGWCLEYVQNAFKSGWAGSSAWHGWTTITKKKHSGTPPKGVYVPIWFDGLWNGQRLGHVAIYKDGKVWSSPYRNGQSYAVLPSIKETERIYGMKYVGWSEDLGGTTIVKENKVAKATAAQVTKAYKDILERNPDAGGLKHYTTNGMTEAQVRADLMKSAERKKLEARKKAQAEAAKKEAEAKKAAEAAAKARAEAEAKAKAEEEAKKAHVDKYAEENNALLKQILALIKSIFNR